MLFRDNKKLAPLVQEISWAKNIIIMEKCKDDLEREFYIRMTKKFGWSKDVLIHQVENQSYEKYLLNQTNFDKSVPEKYRHQAKLAVEEFFIDLLLYHRKLQCLVAVELKIGKFKPDYAGQMQFYLSVLDDKVKLEGENPSIGIIICKSKDRTIVEYTLRDVNKPLGVSTYKVSRSLPKEMKKYLPAPGEIEKRLSELISLPGSEKGEIE